MNRRFTTLRLLVATAALLALAACETSGGGNGAPGIRTLDPPEFELQKEAALTSFDACLDMEAYLTDLAVAELLRGTSGYGYSDSTGGGSTIGVDAGAWGGGGAVDVVAAPSMDAGSGSSGGTGGGTQQPGDRPSDWTGTNNQTEGVDEADIVKTDGAYVYAVAGRTLRVIDAWPPEEAAEVGTLALENAPFEMFVHEDTALLFTRLQRGALPADFQEAVRPDRAVSEFLLLTVVDLSDRAAPRVVRTLHVEGGYVSARMTGGTAFVVARSSVSLDRSTGWSVAPSPGGSGGGGAVRPDTGNIGVDVGVDVGIGVDIGMAPSPDTSTPDGPPPAEDAGAAFDAGSAPAPDAGFDRRGFALTADEAEEAVAAIISRRTADDWLPRYRDAVVDGDSETVDNGLVVACDDVYRPATPFGQDLLVVLAVDLNDPLGAWASQAVIGGAETVYASTDALYVAAQKNRYWYYENLDAAERDRTAIHEFALAGGTPQYRASGDVAGHLLNQFALDEYDGHLRVATTTGEGWGANPLESHVLVLGENDGRLEEVGRLDGLGPDENIYAVRFLGDRGFVVTFRQVDPLFTLDLSDPTTPRLVGELQIPGFSTYLHPMDEDHLLAIGQSQSGQVGGEWFEEEWGVKLAIYDISDLANPRELEKTVIANAESEAQYDHRAFTYYAAQGVLAVPFQRWDYGVDEPAAGLYVYDVSVENGFARRGAVHHALLTNDLVAALPDDVYCWGAVRPDRELPIPAPAIRRSLFLEDYLYTVSPVGLQVNPLANLSETTAAIPFADVCALVQWCDLPECRDSAWAYDGRW